MRPRPAGVALAALVVLAGCGGTPRPGSSGSGDYLEQGVWLLQAVDEVRVADRGGDTPWFRVSPVDGRVEGSTGCNAFSGAYRAGGTSVTFGPLEATERGCADAGATDVERRMLEIMQAADGYRIESGRLLLLVRGSIRMVFGAAG